MLPQILSKNNKNKSPIFSNPLIGKIYNNESFSKKINNHTIKNMSQKHQFQQQKSIISIKHTKQQVNKSKLTKTIDNHSINTDRPKKLYFDDQVTNFKLNKKIVSPKACQYHFENIKLIWLDLLEVNSQVKQLQVNLSEYFKIITNKKLSGPLTQQFLTLAEQYLRQFIQGDYNIQLDEFPNSIFNVSDKQHFLNILNKYREDKQTQMALTKYYLVPLKQIRQSMFRDIMLNLTKVLYKQLRIGPSPELQALIHNKQPLHILDATGKKLTDICQIYFSTKVIYLTNDENFKKKMHYQFLRKIKKLQKQRSLTERKNSFNKNLRIDFRKLISKGKYDDSWDYDPQIINTKQKRISKAQHLVRRHHQSQINKSKIYKNNNQYLTGSCIPKNQSNIASSSSTPLNSHHKNYSFLNKSTINKKTLECSSKDDESQISQNSSLAQSKMLSGLGKKAKKKQRQQRPKIDYIINVSKQKLYDRLSDSQIKMIFMAYNNQQQKQSTFQFQIKNHQEQIIDFLVKYFFKFGNLSQRICDSLSLNKFKKIINFILNDNNRKVKDQDKMQQAQLFSEMIQTWLIANNFVTVQSSRQQNQHDAGKKVILIQKFRTGFKTHNKIYKFFINLIFGQYEGSIIDVIYQILLIQ